MTLKISDFLQREVLSNVGSKVDASPSTLTGIAGIMYTRVKEATDLLLSGNLDEKVQINTGESNIKETIIEKRAIAVGEQLLESNTLKTKVEALTEELKNRLQSFRTKDEELQLALVKVDALEKKKEIIQKKLEEAEKLNESIKSDKKTVSALQKNVNVLQAENDKLKEELAKPRDLPAHVVPTPIQAKPVQVDSTLVVEEIKTLQLAIKHLKLENRRLIGLDVQRKLAESLPPLPIVKYVKKFAGTNTEKPSQQNLLLNQLQNRHKMWMMENLSLMLLRLQI